MKIAIISFTENGDIINKKISSMPEIDFISFRKSDGLFKKNCSIYEWTKEFFYKCDALIFIGAIGIAVRSISPFLKSKCSDPAVIVCDDIGKFVIPILSGHIGGANELAKKIASFLNSTPVITTSTDINNIWAVDLWAKNNGYLIQNIENIKFISSALICKKDVGIFSDFPILSKLPQNIINDTELENGIVISVYKDKKIFKNNLNIIPKCLYVGVGSKKNVDEYSIINLFNKICKENGFLKESFVGVGTINIKKEEPAVLKFAEYINCKIKFFSSYELNSINGNFLESQFVKNVTGCGNICERAAVLISGGKILINKTAYNGVTISIAISDWSVRFENCYGWY